jgi:hypothetical protein
MPNRKMETKMGYKVQKYVIQKDDVWEATD